MNLNEFVDSVIPTIGEQCPDRSDGRCPEWVDHFCVDDTGRCAAHCVCDTRPSRTRTTMISPPAIPPAIADHIRVIIDEFWDKEAADYRDNTGPGHPFLSLRAVDTWLTAATPTVPDIGDTFDRDGRRQVVTAWYKRNPAPLPTSRPAGPDQCPLVFCAREEAEYVGTGGPIVRVADVRVTGRVGWSDDMLTRHRATIATLVGRGEEVVV